MLLDFPSIVSQNTSKISTKSDIEIEDASISNHLKAFPTKENIQKLLGDTMIIHQPMSIVGGDGYWVQSIEDAVIIIAFDCMGHGRLASMMTRVYVNAVNIAIVQNRIHDPGQILHHIHHQVVVQFKEKGYKRIGTGADMVVLKIPNHRKYFECCGAKMDLIFMNKGVVNRIKGNRQSIGEYFDQPREYITKKFEFLQEEKTRFYMYSDGVTDLFGGPFGKKFKFSNLEILLSEIDHLSIIETEQVATKRLSSWAAFTEPSDDLLLMGFEIRH